MPVYYESSPLYNSSGLPRNQEYAPIYESSYQRDKSSLGHERSQQRFGRLNFHHVPTDDTHDCDKEESRDLPTVNAFLKSLRSSRPEPVARGQWIDDVEQTDTRSQLPLVHIEILQHKILGMQKELQKLETQQSEQVKKQYQIIYRIGRTCYFDHPEWTEGHKSIISRIPVKNLDLFLERNKSIVFIVYRDFEPSSTRKVETKIASSPPKNVRESIRPVNRRLRKIFESILAQDWRYESYLHHLRQTGEINAPYLFVYHNRSHWKDMMAQFPRTVREHLNLFAIYVSDNYGEEYTMADTHFARREISTELVKYFFQPGDILVSRATGQYRGYIANSWPQDSASAPVRGSKHLPYQRAMHGAKQSHWQSDDDDSGLDTTDVESVSSDSADDDKKGPEAVLLNFPSFRMPRSASAKKEKHEKYVSARGSSKEFPINVFKWSFDGDFKREADKIILKLSRSAENASTNAKVWSIDDLEIYPLSFAPPAVAQKLRRRGKMFWECRKRCLISYRETSTDAHDEVGEASSPFMSMYMLQPMLIYS